jgi:hypothetical protein
MAFSSAAEEIGRWAERCRMWADGARTREQRVMLHSLEMVLSKAAMEAQQELGPEQFSPPLAHTKS